MDGTVGGREEYEVLVVGGGEYQEEILPVLKDAGLQVSTVSHPVSAMYSLENEEYDIIIGHQDSVSHATDAYDWDDFYEQAVQDVGGKYVSADGVNTDNVVRHVGEHISDIERDEAVQDQARYLERIIDSLVHDLRNPLNVIEGRLPLAQEEEGDEHFGAIKDNLERLTRRLERGVREKDAWKEGGMIREYDTDELFEEVIRDCEAHAGRNGMNLHSDADRVYTVEGPDDLPEAVGNLVRNAIDYSEGGNVWLDAGPSEEQVDIIELYVDDDGKGIPWDDVGVPEGDTEALKERETGLNTGEGLDNAQRVAAQVGGYLHIIEGGGRSENGTRVTVGVPAADGR